MKRICEQGFDQLQDNDQPRNNVTTFSDLKTKTVSMYQEEKKVWEPQEYAFAARWLLSHNRCPSNAGRLS